MSTGSLHQFFWSGPLCLFAACTGTAVVPPPPPETPCTQVDLVTVAAVDVLDAIAANNAHVALSDQGIYSEQAGSIMASLYVKPGDQERARSILARDRERLQYSLFFLDESDQASSEDSALPVIARDLSVGEFERLCSDLPGLERLVRPALRRSASGSQPLLREVRVGTRCVRLPGDHVGIGYEVGLILSWGGTKEGGEERLALQIWNGGENYFVEAGRHLLDTH